MDQFLMAALTTGYVPVVQADDNTPVAFYGVCGRCKAHTMVTTSVDGDAAHDRCVECKQA
jgi:hypothetical protein